MLMRCPFARGRPIVTQSNIRSMFTTNICIRGSAGCFPPSSMRVPRPGYRQMIGYIDASNQPSIHLHDTFGFRQVGYLPSIGFKFGRWTDSVIMQRSLGPGATTHPTCGPNFGRAGGGLASWLPPRHSRSQRRRQATSRTILPRIWPASLALWASAAPSRGSVRPIVGRSFPASASWPRKATSSPRGRTSRPFARFASLDAGNRLEAAPQKEARVRQSRHIGSTAREQFAADAKGTFANRIEDHVIANDRAVTSVSR